MKYYPTETEELKQTPHIVAFLDFLGAGNKMKNPNLSDEFLKTMQEIYDTMTCLLKLYNSAWTVTNNKNDVKFQFFSDNVVIAKECMNEKDFADGCQEIFTLCSFFQASALMAGTSFRGAITYGKFCKSKLFVYGEALVRAYELEEKLAIYPRIIIDKNMIEKLDISEYIVKQDFDGAFFVNFPLPPAGSITFKYLDDIKAGIEAGFKTANDSPVVMQKYHWLVNKFNEFCEETDNKTKKIVLIPKTDKESKNSINDTKVNHE